MAAAATFSVNQNVIPPENSSGEKVAEEESQIKPNLHWMVKPCEEYQEEYSDCKSFKAKFHQYFVNGETTDCTPWKKDLENCNKWEKHQDVNALAEVIESEKSRIRERLQGHVQNDVWEPRQEPPEDWDEELPEDILEEYSGSFLRMVSNDLKEGKDSLDDYDPNYKEPEVDSSDSMCSIV